MLKFYSMGFIEKRVKWCQRAQTVRGFWKPQNTRVTVTQRRMTRLKQEIASRKTYPGWSQQSRVIRGYEWTRPTFLGLHWIPLLWIYKHLAIILLWQMHSLSDRQMGLTQKARFLQVPPSCPTDESCVYFRCWQEKVIGPSQDIRTCFKRHRKYPLSQTTAPNGLHVTDRVWPQCFQNSRGNETPVLRN